MFLFHFWRLKKRMRPKWIQRWAKMLPRSRPGKYNKWFGSQNHLKKWARRVALRASNTDLVLKPEKLSFCYYLQRLVTPTRRITARQRSTVTCVLKTLSKIDKNMLNLHFVREWHTFFWAQNQLKMKIRRFFRCFCLKIAQNLNFTQVFPRFFPQALLCGFSKLQLQTQATAQVGKSHSGRS